MNPREELVGMMRGFFATPVLVALGKRNVLNMLIEGEVEINKLAQTLNSKKLTPIFLYLKSLGLVENCSGDKDIFASTELGLKIFKRFGSLLLLYSYRDLISNIDALLFKEDFALPVCDRLDNVIGSGLTNGRKFFPAGVEALHGLDVSLIADLCCGNGEFIRQVHEVFPEVKGLASDLSPIAIEETISNLKVKSPSLELHSVQSNVLDCDRWLNAIDQVKVHNNEGKKVISMWYLLHEISQKNVNVVADLLTEIYSKNSELEIIVGEIINIPEEILAGFHQSSIMPEFLLFHEFSGQGVLTWDQYQEILTLIPYKLSYEKKLDIVKSSSGEDIPSAFVWRLSPNKA